MAPPLILGRGVLGAILCVLAVGKFHVFLKQNENQLSNVEHREGNAPCCLNTYRLDNEDTGKEDIHITHYRSIFFLFFQCHERE